jgi:hypothetical protein
MAYLTTMTLVTAPSVVLPLNLLLFADSAVPPAMAVVFSKKLLFDKRIVPPARTFAPILFLENMLSVAVMLQPELARIAPLAPVVWAK